MILFIDCEGTPMQEFSALYVNEENGECISCAYYDYDCHAWARRHIHGLNLHYLAKNALKDEDELLCTSLNLQAHLYRRIFANAPLKGKDFLNVSVRDVQLPLWNTITGFIIPQTPVL